MSANSNKIVRALRWLAGCEPVVSRPTHDDFEPYCTEGVLQSRIASRLVSGEAKAIEKIGARYGAEL